MSKGHISIYKKGFRVLAIAESFRKDLFPVIKKSVLAAIIMRGDFQIDGFAFNFVTVGGLDATEKILELITSMNRPDITLIMINGTIISLYNVIDLNKIYHSIGKPIIAVSYEESEGVEKYLSALPNGAERLRVLLSNGPRIPVVLKNSFKIFIRPVGISIDDALYALNRFIIHGRYPEPIRVAKLLARSVLNLLILRAKEICEAFSQPTSNEMR
ncbi:MAG: endonuclease dU [Candidatus Njordarchaeales archaeon]